MSAVADRALPWTMAIAAVAIAIYVSFIGLTQLDYARTELADARQAARIAVSPIARWAGPGNARTEATRDMAVAALRSRLSQAALDQHLLIERIAIQPVVPAASAEIAVGITVSGPETAVLRYAHELERDRPLLRFIDWRLQRTAAGDGTIRLDGRVAAIWAGR